MEVKIITALDAAPVPLLIDITEASMHVTPTGVRWHGFGVLLVYVYILSIIQAQAHPESCLAVIDSDSSVWSYETGTPPATPVLSPKMSNDPDTCLAVMGEASVLGVRSFETGTPITTPITSPISSPTKLLPSPMSESSVEEDLFADGDNGLTTLDSIPL